MKRRMGVVPTVMTILRDYRSSAAACCPTSLIAARAGHRTDRCNVSTLRVRHRAGRRVRSAAGDQSADQVIAARIRFCCWRAARSGRCVGASVRRRRAPVAGAGARSLASFDDVWQTINDTFYDPTFGGVDWAAVRARIAAARRGGRVARRRPRGHPRDARPARPLAFRAALDRHRPPTRCPGRPLVPIEIRILDARRRHHARDARRRWPSAPGLRAGDSADGRSTAQPPTLGGRRIRPRRARGAISMQWRAAFRALHGADGSTAVLRVREPHGRERELSVTRAMGAGETVQLGNLPPLQVCVEVARELKTPGGRRVGVIAFNIWMAAINDAGRAGRRSVPDRTMARDSTCAAIRAGWRDDPRDRRPRHRRADSLLGTMQTRDSAARVQRRIRGWSTTDGRRVAPFAGPVAILVDELTASASECFAGALQSLGRARIFGRPDDGAGAAGVDQAAAQRRRADARDRRLRHVDRPQPRGRRRDPGRAGAARPSLALAGRDALTPAALTRRSVGPLGSDYGRPGSGRFWPLGSGPVFVILRDLQARTSFRVRVVSDPETSAP